MINILSKIFNAVTFLLLVTFATVAFGIGTTNSQSFQQYMDEMIAQTLIQTSGSTEFRKFPIENNELEHLRKLHKDTINCMALNIYHEAKNQSVTGQIAVGLVVINRVKDNRFPSTICDVIMQGPIRESWKTKRIQILTMKNVCIILSEIVVSSVGIVMVKMTRLVNQPLGNLLHTLQKSYYFHVNMLVC